MAMQITDTNFEALLAEGKPMIVDFWAVVLVSLLVL